MKLIKLSFFKSLLWIVNSILSTFYTEEEIKELSRVGD